MTPLFAAGGWWTVALHLPVLLVAVSLVYSATRHDRWPLILREALTWGVRMAGFLLGLGVLLWVLSSYQDLWPVIMIPVVIGMAVYYAWNSPWYRRLREQKEKADVPPVARAK
jgi:uncharacterized membrane protein YjfL (UPF0719 family)